jgi:formamidopyrimidine-DNA glycosylase
MLILLDSKYVSFTIQKKSGETKQRMPELPEVETLCRQLKQTVVGAVVQDVTILDSKLGHPVNMAGHLIVSVERQGKYLILHLDKGPTLHLHLRMSGRLLWHSRLNAPPAHSRFIIRFPHGSLVCIDPRRFATLVRDDLKDRTARIPDPLKTFKASILLETARGRQASVKTFLLNQSVIAGIGNIYACEILHRAAVSPWRRAGSLSPVEWRKVAQAGRNILRKATACRGTSISDWRDLYGREGEYQNHLAVYDREGDSCMRCGEMIQRTTIGGRGTYSCAVCQK